MKTVGDILNEIERINEAYRILESENADCGCVLISENLRDELVDLLDDYRDELLQIKLERDDA